MLSTHVPVIPPSPLVFFKGAAMGAADIVPGVSGGTIAFVTGIYPTLLGAIGAIPEALVKELARGQVRQFWTSIQGGFLLSLFAGILCSVIGLASVITWLLRHQEIMIWSFFFGLVVASVGHCGRTVKHWSPSVIAALLLGIGSAFWIVTLSPAEVAITPLTLFGAGALAICAMVLPGISGSFILLLLGMYAPVLAAVKGLELQTLLIFASGCLVGLLSFTRLLSAALRRFPDLMIALLTGFMAGSLGKLWPWKLTVEWQTDRHGERVPLDQILVSPLTWADTLGADPQLGWAMALAGIGILIVLGFELLGRRAQA